MSDFEEDEDVYCEMALTQYEELSAAQTNRFGNPTTEKAIEELAEKRIPPNTKRNMTWSINVFKAWRLSRNRMFLDRADENDPDFQQISWKNLEDMNIEDYNYILPRFVMEARKKTGDRYPANSLWQMLVSIQSFIRMKGHPVRFLKDSEYKPIQDALDNEMKQSNLECFEKTKQADVVDEGLEDLLWSHGILGRNDPQKLLHSLMYLVGYHFALRASEHKSLEIGRQLSIHTDENGEEYLRYKEIASKTYDGGIKARKKEPRESRAYANSLIPDRCPVQVYKDYIDKCPQDNRPPQLYLHPLTPAQRKKDQWYARRPVGIHFIEGFLKKITSQVGGQGRFTPHSLRATNATRLFHKGIEEQLIMEQTGHSSLAVRRYKRTSSGQKKEISNLLQRKEDKSPKKIIPPLPDTDSAEEFQEPIPKFLNIPGNISKIELKKSPSATVSKPPEMLESTVKHIHIPAPKIPQNEEKITNIPEIIPNARSDNSDSLKPNVDLQVDGVNKTVSIKINF